MEEKGEKMEVVGMGREDGLERLMAGMERRKGWDGGRKGSESSEGSGGKGRILGSGQWAWEWIRKWREMERECRGRGRGKGPASIW